MLKKLNEDFQVKTEELLFECERQGVIMRPFAAVRSPHAQARLWRQSRTIMEIRAQIAKFRQQGAFFLAKCLEDAGPQFGRWATNALPGMSWHQHGYALDCFWAVDGSAVWDVSERANGDNGYKIYAKTAERIGLVSLGPGLGDWVHAQFFKGTPISHMSILEIDAAMKGRES